MGKIEKILKLGQLYFEGIWLVIFTFYRVADKSLARPGWEKATATEDFEFHISYL